MLTLQHTIKHSPLSVKRSNFIQLIVILLLATQALNAQNVNNRYPVSNGWGGAGLNALENDSGYFAAGAYLSLTTGKQNIHVLQTDFNGNILFQKIYGDATYTYATGFQGSLIKLNSGGYAMYGGRRGSTNGSNVALLFRFNEVGDTLWTKTYGDTVVFQTGRHMQQTPDGGFILIGDNSQTTARHWVIKTDSLGTIEWQQFYGGPGLETPTQIAVCNDGGYIFTGWTRSAGPGTPAKDNIRITKIDSIGNEEFTKIFGETNDDTPWSIIQTQDGGYIFGGAINLDANGFRYPYAIKLDNLGDTVWTRTYPEPGALGNGNDDFKTIIELPDGNLMAAGWQWDTDGVTFGRHDGLIIKLKPNGDTLWHRTYRIPWMNANGTDFEIKDIRPTTDGGFICGGVVYPAFPDTGSQDMWLLKIDSNGCVDTANCYISVGVANVPIIEQQQLLIYPNPTNAVVTIELPYTTGKIAATFRLLDVTGKEVLSKNITAFTTQLDVGWLPKGVYFYRYLNKEQQLSFAGKLVVD